MVPNPPAANPVEPPSSFALEGGMVVALLSPGPARIATLRAAWKDELEKQHLDPADPAFADGLAEKMHRKGVEPPSLRGRSGTTSYAPDAITGLTVDLDDDASA